MNKDLTARDPGSVLWRFCLPLFGSIIFQQLYNIADTLVAGKFIGEQALAAVGNSYEITLIFIAFTFGCNMGCSIIVSRLFGAQKLNDMKTACYTAMIASGVLCLALMLFGLVCCDWLLSIIRTPSEIYAGSRQYLRIYTLGLPFLFFYNISNGIFTAMGDSRTPFRFLAVSSTANIAMDILFVVRFHMGIAGVAWATFLCQGASCILAVCVVLKRMHMIHTTGTVKLFSRRLFREIVVVAVPSILQQSFISLGNIMIQSVINGFGSSVVAGYSAAVKLDNLVLSSFTTLGNGISNYTAQNVGAGKLNRVRAGCRAGVKMVLLICVPIILLYLVAGKYLMYFFMDDPSEQALESGIRFLRIVSPFYIVISMKLMLDGILRGAKLMKEFMVATFAALFVRVTLVFLLSELLGYVGACFSWPFGYSTGLAFSLVYYLRFMKKQSYQERREQ